MAWSVVSFFRMGCTVIGVCCLAGKGGTLAAPPNSAPDGLSALRERMVQAILSAGSFKDANAAPQYASDLRPDGSWADIDYADSAPSVWKAFPHLSRMLAMARLWLDPSSTKHGDPALKEATCRALDWWLQHDYQNPNWWHNQISVPRAVGETLILLGDQAGADRLSRAAVILARSDWVTRVDVRQVTWTGANLTDMAWNRILRGVLQSNPGIVKDAFEKAFQEVRVVAPGEEGIQADFSFHQHGSLVYDGGYGEAFVQGVSRFIVIADGTPFAPTRNRRDVFDSYLLDGAQWMIRAGLWDYGVIGRSITRTGRSAAGMAAPLESIATLPGPRQTEIAAFAKRLRDPKAQPLVGNRQFWRSDLMVHQRPRWYASARGYSTRTLSTDGPHNAEGLRSHYLADGANFLIRDGKEYLDIFPVWDWRKIPGTTVVQSNAPMDPLHPHRAGTTSFVGGVSDGMYGMFTVDLDHGGLTVAKSWFFFDEEYVCLGAGMRDGSGSPVATTIDQRYLRGPVRVDGQATPVFGSGEALATRWVLHDGVGYVFTEGAGVHLDTRKRSGKWSDIGTGSSTPVEKDIFTLWLDHGPTPKGLSYVYEVVPNAGANDLDERIIRDPVTVLSNTRDVQAVRHEALHMVQAAFRKPGSVDLGDGWTITIDKPCLLMARRTGATVRVAVANPLNKRLVVNVTISGAAQLEKTRKVAFDLPDGPLAGSSVVKDAELPN